MGISNKLKTLRKEKGYTQSELAKLVGVSLPTMVRYEKGESEPRHETLELIANVLEVNVSDLFGFTPDEWSEDLDAVAVFSSQAMKDETKQKIAKLLIGMTDKQIHQVLMILEVLANDSVD